MKKTHHVVVWSILFLLGSLLVTPALAEETRIVLSAPSSVVEGTQFQVQARLEPLGGFGQPPDSNIVTIEFLGEFFETDTAGIVVLTAPLVDADTDYEITATKIGYPENNIMITVTNVMEPGVPQPQLQISVPSTVLEGNTFTVTVKADNVAVASVMISFNGNRYTTNQNGQAELPAPLVDEDAFYSITATKENYKSMSSSIQVLNQVENTGNQTQNGLIVGTVTDVDDNPLEDVTVCFVSSEGSPCVLTDRNGRYSYTAQEGTYTIEASKQGYVTSSLYGINVAEDTEVEINFTVEQIASIPEIPEPYPAAVADLTVQWGIEHRLIGASITATSETTQSMLYNTDLSIVFEPVENSTVSFTIAGPDGTLGTIVALRIPNAQDLLDVPVVELQTLSVTYDGDTINMAESFEELFSTPQTAAEPVWAAIIAGQDVTILVRIPHFSTHTITVSSIAQVIETIGGVTAFILYGCAISVLAVLTAIPIIRLWRKIE